MANFNLIQDVDQNSNSEVLKSVVELGIDRTQKLGWSLEGLGLGVINVTLTIIA